MVVAKFMPPAEAGHGLRDPPAMVLGIDKHGNLLPLQDGKPRSKPAAPRPGSTAAGHLDIQRYMSLHAWKNGVWVPAMALGTTGPAKDPPEPTEPTTLPLVRVMYEDTLLVEVVPIDELCSREGPPSLACKARGIYMAGQGRDGWLRVEEASDKLIDGVLTKQYRASSRNNKVRVLTTSGTVAEAGMWADVVENDRQRRNGGIITDAKNPKSLRNFTPELWLEVAKHLGLPPDMRFDLPADTFSTWTAEGSQTVDTATQGMTSGIKRGSPSQQQGSSKRHHSASPGPRSSTSVAGSRGPGPPRSSSCGSPLGRRAGVAAVTSSQGHPSQRHSQAPVPAGCPAVAAAAAAGGGMGGNYVDAAAARLSQQMSSLSASDSRGAHSSGKRGASGMVAGSRQLPPRPTPGSPFAAAVAAAAAAGMGQQGLQGGEGVLGQRLHNGHGTESAAAGGVQGTRRALGSGSHAGSARPPAAPNPFKQLQQVHKEGAPAAGGWAGSGGSGSNSSRRIQGTPAAPPVACVLANQNPAAAAAVVADEAMAAAGGGQQRAGVHSAGVRGGAPPALPSRGVQLSEPAAPAAAAAPGAGRIAAAAPPAKPAAAPAAQAPEQQAIHQQQQQQQQQKRKKKKRQQQEQQLAAEATNGAVGLGDMTAGEELQLWLFDVAASPVSMPLVYQKYLSAGGQAGVLLVEQRVQQEWHKSLQASGWQAGQPPLTWAALPALCATSSGAGAPSAGAAAAAATGRGAAAAAAASPPELRALKVGLPFRPQKQGESIATWERKRIAHMDKIGKALWREHTLLTRAHSNKPARFDCLVQTYAYGAVKLPTCEYPLPALLLEYCPEGSLDRHLSEPRSPGQPPEPGLTYETARELMQTVCRAVKHLHGQHIVHRDIKCSNVLLVKGGGGKLKAKLADLGMALDFMDGHPSNDVVFSGYYCPPEIEEQQFHDVRSDSWLVGALLLHMRTAELPWLYMFKRTGSLAGRGAGELDNPDSPYFKLEKDEKEVLRLCLAPFGKRLPLRDIMAKFPQYLGC